MFRLFRIKLENFDQSISITIAQAITVPQQLRIRYLKMCTSLYDIFCGNLNSLLKYLIQELFVIEILVFFKSKKKQFKHHVIYKITVDQSVQLYNYAI